VDACNFHVIGIEAMDRPSRFSASRKTHLRTSGTSSAGDRIRAQLSRRPSRLEDEYGDAAWVRPSIILLDEFAVVEPILSVDDAKEGYLSAKAAQILGNSYFDGFATFLICLNGMSIGIESQMSLNNEDTTFLAVLENCFLVFYIFELSLWFIAMGLKCLHNNWVKLDCFFVILGVSTTWIIGPLLDATGTSSGDSGVESLLLLRMLRLFRLARAIRLIYRFQELLKLVNGIITSFGTMIYVLLLLFVILYVFACFALEFITNASWAKPAENTSATPYQVVVADHFANIWITMLTLVQCITMDSFAAVYTPVIKKAPWLGIYFVFLILVVNVVLMNLVTAVIVEGALERSEMSMEIRRKQEESKRTKLVIELQDMCHRFDTDGSGSISLEELTQCMDTPTFNQLQQRLEVTRPEAVLQLLGLHEDDDDIPIDDFCAGVLELALFDGPKQLLRLEKVSAGMHGHLKNLESKMDSMKDMMTRLLEIQEIERNEKMSTTSPSAMKKGKDETNIGKPRKTKNVKVVFSRSSSDFPENNEKFDAGGRSTLTVETEGGGRASLKVEAEGGGRASSKVEAEDGGGASLKVEADNGGSASLKDPESNN